MTSTLRIALVANKTWECEPLVATLLAKDARPALLSPRETSFRRGYDPAEEPPVSAPPAEADGLPLRGNAPVRPRLSIRTKNAELALEVWCIEDWMRSKRKRRKADGSEELVDASGSSSHEKLSFSLARIKERAFGGVAPDMVVAFGTAGIPTDESVNGCVTIGSRVYIHDPWFDAPQAEIDQQIHRFGPMLRAELDDVRERPIESPRLKATLFSNDISMDARHSAEARFIEAPIHGARSPRILAGHGFASLGTVNICDYDDYVWADEETLRLFEKNVRQREIGSMETTHGLIRLTWKDVPFLFVSGITDRVPLFNLEVTPRKYSQNFVAAHNAGIATAFLIGELTRLHVAGTLFA